MSMSHHIGCSLLGEFEAKALGGSIFAMTGQFGVTVSKEGLPDISLQVRGNHHGIRNGWCSWPLDFDTIWIEKCDFYKKTEEKTKETENV